MPKQVITIHPDGSASGLQVKPGKGLDLRKFGKAKIVRASEVLFCEERQLWYVEFREAGKYSGQRLTKGMHAKAVFGIKCLTSISDDTVYFEEYENAVAAEIAVLDHYRLNDLAGLRTAV